MSNRDVRGERCVAGAVLAAFAWASVGCASLPDAAGAAQADAPSCKVVSGRMPGAKSNTADRLDAAAARAALARMYAHMGHVPGSVLDEALRDCDRVG